MKLVCEEVVNSTIPNTMAIQIDKEGAGAMDSLKKQQLGYLYMKLHQI